MEPGESKLEDPGTSGCDEELRWRSSRNAHLALAAGLGAAGVVVAILETFLGGPGFGMVRHLVFPDGSAGTLTSAMLINLVLGYAATGVLLAALGSVTVPDMGSRKQRLTRLQIILLLGAVLFTAGAAAERDLLDIAALELKDAAVHAKTAFDAIAAIWGFAGAAFLVTGVGVAYAALRSEAETAALSDAAPRSGEVPRTPPPPLGGSPLALKTADGEELAALGWVISIFAALAPAVVSIFKTALPVPPL